MYNSHIKEAIKQSKLEQNKKSQVIINKMKTAEID